jgi:hypothetical protein
VGRTRHGPQAGYGAGSEPRLDRMACFWSLPKAVRARAGAKLSRRGGTTRVRCRSSQDTTVSGVLTAVYLRIARRARGGFQELVTMDRSAKIFLPVRTVTWALDGTGDQG